MVFSSIPAYLDPPNWQQQQNQHQANHGSESSCQLLITPPLPQQHHQAPHVAAPQQLAKIPTSSETAAPLKCPRCDSTNTKFCYYNNYNLSQPRHFCKTCRRYWTRGGALRNVPVGGGCRRNNKKSKRTKSPPTVSSNDKEYSLSNSTSAIHSFINSNHDQQIIGQFAQPIINRPNNNYMMNSLQNLNRFGTIGVGNISLMGLQNSTNSTGGEGGILDQSQWRLQQFPFLNGFDQSTSASAVVSFPFQSEIVEAPTSRVTTQLPSSVKLEYNLSRSPPPSYNSWGTTDLSAFASASSASHHHHNLL